MLISRNAPYVHRNQLAKLLGTGLLNAIEKDGRRSIDRDLENKNLQDLLRLPSIRKVPALRSIGDAFAVLKSGASTKEERAAAISKLNSAYQVAQISSLMEGLRTIAGAGISDLLGLYWSKITPRAASVRKEISNDSLALKLFNAIHAVMTGGAATVSEISNLAKVITSAPPREISKAIQITSSWATLVMRQELVAPYEGMSQERLADEISRGGIPAPVLQAARDLTAQGIWAPGLFEANIARKLVQIAKYETVIGQFLEKKKWASYSDISRNAWSDIPDEVQTVVKRLVELRQGVDVSWGGGVTKVYFDISDGAGALGDLYLALTVDGGAYLADLKDKANQLVLALKMMTSLLSKPPSSGADSASFANDAVAYAETLKKQLAVVFGDGVSEGVLKEFTDSLAAASEYGISKAGLDNQLKIAFPDDIDGDGKVENTMAGFFTEISGLVAGPGGLLDVAIAAVEKTQDNYRDSASKEAKARMAAMIDLVFGIASSGAGIAAGALKVSTSIADLAKKGPNFRKALGDLGSTIGATLGVTPTINSAINTFGASKEKLSGVGEYAGLSASVTAISDKLDQLKLAFFDLYRTLGPDLPKQQIGNFSEDIELEDPGFAGPDREGFVMTWWEKRESDSGPYWLLYGLPIA